MPSVHKSVTDEDEIDTILASDIDFSGHLESPKSILIKGHVTGTITCDDDLYISESGSVNAEILTRRLIVRGTLQGRAKAIESIQILQGSIVESFLEAPDIFIEDREHFRGAIVESGNE